MSHNEDIEHTGTTGTESPPVDQPKCYNASDHDGVVYYDNCYLHKYDTYNFYSNTIA